MINYILLFVFILALTALDRNVIPFLYLQFERLSLAIEKFFFRLKLEVDIFVIKYNKQKYLKMAKEILQELRPDEADSERT